MKNSYSQMVDYITHQVLIELQKKGLGIKGWVPRFVPVGISARHVHLQKEHLVKLFGCEYELTHYRDISQPGQYAANEKVAIVGPKGEIANVRILGPLRSQTQVEITASDGRRLGINPPVRQSGVLEDTPGIKLAGPAGWVELGSGCIIAERHIHMTPNDARIYGVEDGQRVAVKVRGDRGGIMDNVYIRVRDDFSLDMHIDTDDANAFLIKQGDILEIIRGGGV